MSLKDCRSKVERHQPPARVRLPVHPISKLRTPLNAIIGVTEMLREQEIARTTEPIPKISADMSAQEAANVYLRFMKESRTNGLEQELHLGA
jgi:signal transduction histidine kinase